MAGASGHHLGLSDIYGGDKHSVVPQAEYVEEPVGLRE
jgi:hypothetical protein